MGCVASTELTETLGQEPITLSCDYIEPTHLGDHYDALFGLYWRRPLAEVPAIPPVLSLG
jgi:hypothetical protein